MQLLTVKNSTPAIVDDDLFNELSQYTWYLNGNGYPMRFGLRNGKKTGIKLHREVMNHPEGVDVDHRNGNRLDAQRANLRTCSRSENLRNARKTKLPRSSLYKGVCYCKQTKRWASSVFYEGKKVWCGRFESEVDAARAYNNLAASLFKSFACLNMLPEGVVA